MKIAIQGHSTRVKEVIQILESLGGKNKLEFIGGSVISYYFINKDKNIDMFSKHDIPDGYKLYTLEEFEKEFPFKPGDTVIDKDGDEGCIAHLCNINGYIYYSVKYNYNQFAVQSSKSLKLKKKEMNTRNVTLTLDKAKEWYNKGGELKEIALQAYTKEELNPLPKSWEEFCKIYPTIQIKYIFASDCPQKYIALWKLELLRDCYRQGWKPDFSKSGSFNCIFSTTGKYLATSITTLPCFLLFPEETIAKEFLKNFEHLIKEAGDLI